MNTDTPDLIDLMEWNSFADKRKTLLEALTILNNRHRQAIANLNQRLVERQESFQAQLIRIEDVWREKLTESRKDADRLYNCLLEAWDFESGDNSYMKNVLAQHEELVRNG